MPYKVDFDRNHRILRARFHGRITERDLKNFILNAHEHIPNPPPVAAIVDLSAVSSLELSAMAVGILAKIPPIIPDPNLLRLIIAPSAHTYGMSRMFEIQAEPAHPNLHVLQSEREAWAILAVQKPRFEPLLSVELPE